MHTPLIGSVSEPLKFMDDATTEAVIQLRNKSGRYLSMAQVGGWVIWIYLVVNHFWLGGASK